MDQNERQAQVRLLNLRTLEALASLIEQVHDPVARARLEERCAQLRARLKRA